MLERLRSQIGTAGLVVAIVALVAALGGGAYAASGGSDGAKATASAKGKPGPRGKTGKTGPAGPVGPAGPAGPTGPAGATGAPGSPGANGKSVVVSGTAPGCDAGGSSVEVAGEPATKKEVCNGEEGPAGPQGTAGPTCPGGACLLPVGATQTGVWSTRTRSAPNAWIPISFPLRLAAAPTVEWVSPPGGAKPENPECPGTAADPKAKPGHLCIYAGTLNNIEDFGSVEEPAPTVDPTSGVVMVLEATESSSISEGLGSWAVTR